MIIFKNHFLTIAILSSISINIYSSDKLKEYIKTGINFAKEHPTMSKVLVIDAVCTVTTTGFLIKKYQNYRAKRKLKNDIDAIHSKIETVMTSIKNNFTRIENKFAGLDNITNNLANHNNLIENHIADINNNIVNFENHLNNLLGNTGGEEEVEGF